LHSTGFFNVNVAWVVEVDAAEGADDEVTARDASGRDDDVAAAHDVAPVWGEGG
jgi:hypothetical protein